MRTRPITRSLPVLLLSLFIFALIAAGCGSSGSGSGMRGTGASTEATHTARTNPESGSQAYKGFPGAGNPTAPAVTTTPGAPPKNSGGKAGAGSSATCIGC